MRSIHIPRHIIEAARHCKAAQLEYAVCVNWPELRLTEEQVIANAMAAVAGQRSPYPDQSIFSITLDAGEPPVGAA